MPRRFPPPWTVEQIPGDYVVKDATGQAPTSMPARHAIRSVIEIVLQRAAVCSEIPPERGGGKVPFTEDQLTALRGGLTAEEYRWKLIREWREDA